MGGAPPLWWAISNIACKPGDDMKDVFGRAEVAAALSRTAPYATTAAAVQYMWSAVINVALSSHPTTAKVFATASVVDAWLQCTGHFV